MKNVDIEGTEVVEDILHCRHCGSDNIKEYTYVTTEGVYELLRCEVCGEWI